MVLLIINLRIIIVAYWIEWMRNNSNSNGKQNEIAAEEFRYNGSHTYVVNIKFNQI